MASYSIKERLLGEYEVETTDGDGSVQSKGGFLSIGSALNWIAGQRQIAGETTPVLKERDCERRRV